MQQGQANPGYNAHRLTASGQIPNNGGPMGGFLVASGTPIITLYDSQAASGYVIINALQTVAGQYYPCPHNIHVGLYATLTGAGDVTFFVG